MKYNDEKYRLRARMMHVIRVCEYCANVKVNSRSRTRPIITLPSDYTTLCTRTCANLASWRCYIE